VKQLATDWIVYSETGIPVWLALLGLALALGVAHAWLRTERGGRRNAASRLLPWTLTAILLLAATVLWRPVLVRTTTWENMAEIVAVTDPSLSMQLALRPQGCTAQLDVAAAWDAGAVAGRNQAARALREQLATPAFRADQLATSLEGLIAGADQGVPIGRAAAAQMEAFRALHKTAPVEIASAAAAVQPLVNGTGAVGTVESRRPAADALAAVEKAMASLPEPPASGSELSLDLLRGLLPPLTACRRAADACLPLLDQLQEDSDRAFCAANKARLGPALAAAVKRTRTDLAAHAAAELPAGTVAAPPVADRDQTDLYEQVGQAIESLKGRVVSHCVLFSDGAQNGAAVSPVAARMKKDGVRLVAVGTGLAGQTAHDVAVLDWRLPRVLRAGKPARLRAEVKASPGTPFKVTLYTGDQALAAAESVATASGVTAVALDFKAPAEGRQVLRLAVSSTAAANLSHNAVQIQADCTAHEPRLLLVGTVPDWDTAWFSLAARREGSSLTQVYTAGDPPKRGGLSRAIPSSLLQWTRYRAVMLHGPAFAGFSEQDAAELYRFVSEKGGNLLVFAENEAGFGVPLAARFGWTQKPRSLDAPLRLAPAAAALPCLRLAADGPQSARRFAALPPPAAAFLVPAQDIVLVETEQGEPVCSLGFYGRGKVIQWGIRGLHRMREFDNALVVDRWLDGILGELSAPLVADGSKDAWAIYPPLPQAGRQCLAIVPSTSEKPGQLSIRFGGQDVAPIRADHGNGQFAITPRPPLAEITLASQSVQVPVSDNPGLEILYADFNDGFLRAFAAATGGEYVPALSARQTLAAIAPQTYITKTSDAWHPGSSTILLACLILLAAAHWVLRKLAGLAI